MLRWMGNHEIGTVRAASARVDTCMDCLRGGRRQDDFSSKFLYFSNRFGWLVIAIILVYLDRHARSWIIILRYHHHVLSKIRGG